MPFLTIASTDVDVLTSGATEEEPERIGVSERAFAGNLRSTQRARKRVFSFTTGPVDEATHATLVAFDDGAPRTCTGDALNGASISCMVEVAGSEYIADGLLHRRLVELRLKEV